MSVIFRDARPEDVPAIVAMLADDPLGARRETASDDPAYAAAYAAIDADPGERLIVAERDGAVVGCLQIGLIPGLSRRGALRGQIEGVRVAAGARGAGVGAAMLRWAIGECRRAGCIMVQLTSDASRADARRFYERLGFEASHVGMKLML